MLTADGPAATHKRLPRISVTTAKQAAQPALHPARTQVPTYRAGACHIATRPAGHTFRPRHHVSASHTHGSDAPHAAAASERDTISPTPQGRSCSRRTAAQPPSRRIHPQNVIPLPSRIAQEGACHIAADSTRGAARSTGGQCCRCVEMAAVRAVGDPVRLPDPALTARAFSAGPGRIHLLRSWYHASV